LTGSIREAAVARTAQDAAKGAVKAGAIAPLVLALSRDWRGG
jgi:hypothetical protein